MIYIVTDKIFPFDRDGGTAFTSYETAYYCSQALGLKTEVLYHGNANLDQADIVQSLPFSMTSMPSNAGCMVKLNKIVSNDTVFLNSAFKFWEIYYLYLAITSKCEVYFSAHGSFDVELLKKSPLKVAYINIFVRPFLLFCKKYVCNSSGELHKLPGFISSKSVVVENLFPINTSSFELKEMPDDKNTSSKISVLDNPYVIFGRIDTKKNILKTVSRLFKIGFFENQNLLIIGPETSSGYCKIISELGSELGIEDKIDIQNRLISGSDKIRLFNEVSGLLLFSDSEGLPVVILESLLAGCRCICSSGCNVSHLKKYVEIIDLENLQYEDFVRVSPKVIDYAADVGRKKLKELLIFDSTT